MSDYATTCKQIEPKNKYYRFAYLVLRLKLTIPINNLSINGLFKCMHDLKQVCGVFPSKYNTGLSFDAARVNMLTRVYFRMLVLLELESITAYRTGSRLHMCAQDILLPLA